MITACLTIDHCPQLLRELRGRSGGRRRRHPARAGGAAGLHGDEGVAERSQRVRAASGVPPERSTRRDRHEAERDAFSYVADDSTIGSCQRFVAIAEGIRTGACGSPSSRVISAWSRSFSSRLNAISAEVGGGVRAIPSIRFNILSVPISTN